MYKRQRQQIERALGREIVAVDDRDTYVCRPHAPGEIAAALVGHKLTKANRRGKFLWAETDDELDHLRRELRKATRAAIKHGGVHTGEFIPFRKRGGPCPRCGTTLERATIGGRTTFWCPKEQT